jgi:hypothetical protein
MLIAAAAAIITITQAAWAFVRPIPTASVSTVATAGIKTMILKRCASPAPTKKLTVESTSTFGPPNFNGFAAGRLLPNELILRERDSRYTTGLGITVPIFHPAGCALVTAFRQNSGVDRHSDLGRLPLRAHFLWSTLVDGRFSHCVPKERRSLRIGQRIDGRPPHTWRRGSLHARVLCGGSGSLAPVEVRIGLNRGHWPCAQNRPAMPQAMAGM